MENYIIALTYTFAALIGLFVVWVAFCLAIWTTRTDDAPPVPKRWGRVYRIARSIYGWAYKRQFHADPWRVEPTPPKKRPRRRKVTPKAQPTQDSTK